MKPAKWKKQREKNLNALKSISRNIGITSSLIFLVSTVQNILNAFLVEHVGTISIIAGILALAIFALCINKGPEKLFNNKEDLDNVIELVTAFSIVVYIFWNLWIGPSHEDLYAGVLFLVLLMLLTVVYAIWIFKFKKDRNYHTE